MFFTSSITGFSNLINRLSSSSKTHCLTKEQAIIPDIIHQQKIHLTTSQLHDPQYHSKTKGF